MSREATQGISRANGALIATLVVPLIIVMINFIVTSLTPVTAYPWDDLGMLDNIWRVVQGQSEVDFDNSIGFGPFHLGAIVWRMIGPSRWALTSAIAIFCIVVTVCAAGVISQRPSLWGVPGILFCLVIAFETSSPSVYGCAFWAMGTSATYNRVTVGALAVLMLQWFTQPVASKKSIRWIEVVLAATLLNCLFLLKISAFLLAGGVIAAGLLARNDWKRSLCADAIPTGLVTIAFLITDFVLSGISPFGLIGVYQRAAETRSMMAGQDGIQRMIYSWMTYVPIPFLLIQAWPLFRGGAGWIRLLILLGSYLLFQMTLNVSNSQPATAFLAPACAMVMLQWHKEFYHLAKKDDLCLSLTRITSLTVLIPNAMSTITGAVLSLAWAFGTISPEVIQGPSGLALPVFRDYRGGLATTINAQAINRGILDLQKLGLAQTRIATIDYINPFPSMLGAPSTRGGAVFLGPSYNQRADRLMTPEAVIGDACTIMVPYVQTPFVEYGLEFLLASVAPVLNTAFQQVFDDGVWKIYRRTGPCDG